MSRKSEKFAEENPENVRDDDVIVDSMDDAGGVILVEEDAKKEQEKKVKKEEEKRKKVEEKERVKMEKEAKKEAEKLEKEAKKESEKLEKEQEKSEEKRKKINDIKQKEDEVYKALVQTDYKDLLSTCYSEMDANVDLVTQGIAYGVIIEGSGGVGKTFRGLNKVIEAVGKDEVAYADSFTTPTALYVWMYENRHKSVLVLDDCAGLMNNVKTLAMLKGALWHTNDGKTRVITYLTTKPPKDEFDEPLPRSFQLEARIVIITNFLNDDNPHVKAILSRINRVIVNIPRDELLNICTQIIKGDYGGLTFDERKECLNHLIEYTDSKKNKGKVIGEDLNIRTLFRVMNYRIWAKKNEKGDAWKQLSVKLLQKDGRLTIVEKIMNDETLETAEDKWTKFVELTGESRATYYRLENKVKKQKEKLEKELGKQSE